MRKDDWQDLDVDHTHCLPYFLPCNRDSALFLIEATARKMSPKIVLISGCSSGIGLATAVLLAKDAEKRFRVYATMRNLAKKGQLEEEGKEYLGDTLIIKQMDVSSDESVKNAVQEVLDTEGKIDILCEYMVFVGIILSPMYRHLVAFHKFVPSLCLLACRLD